MLDLGELGYTTKIDDRQYLKALKRMERDAQGTGRSIGRSLAAAFSVYTGYRFVKNLVMTASNLNEAENKFRVVFRSIGAEAQAMREKLQEEFGRSRLESAELLGDTGDILTGFGFAQSQALKLSMEVATLGTDLASFTNFAGGAKGASTALTKALLGETESAKALGIVIRQDSEEFINLVEHYRKAEHMTLLQAKAMAALDIAKRQSVNATGDYARTEAEFANQARRVGEVLKDQAATLGEHLIPMVSRGLRLVESVATVVGKIPGPVISATGYFAAWIATMMGIRKAAEMLRALNRVVLEAAAKAAATKAATAATVADTGAEAANTVATEANAAAKAKAAAATMADAEAETANTIGTEANAAAKASDAVATKADAAAKLEGAGAAVVDTAATGGDAVATTLLGKAKLFAAAATKALRAAMLANPVTAIAIGIMIVVSALKALADRSREATRAQLEEARQERQAARARLASGDSQRMADAERMDRLQRLADVERLSNDQMEEAKELIDELSQRHRDLGVQLDANNHRLTIQAGAQAKLNEQLRKQRDREIEAEMASIKTEMGIRQNRREEVLNSSLPRMSTATLKQFQEDTDELIKLQDRLNSLEDVMKTNRITADEQAADAEERKRAKRTAMLKDIHDQEQEWADARLDALDREMKAMQDKVDKQKENIRLLQSKKALEDELAEKALRVADEQLEFTRQRIDVERRFANARKASDEQSARDEERRNNLRIRLLRDGKLSPQDEAIMSRLDVQLESERVKRARAAQNAASRRVSMAKGAVTTANGAGALQGLASAVGLSWVSDRFQGAADKQAAAQAELERSQKAWAAARRELAASQANLFSRLADYREMESHRQESRDSMVRDVERSGGFLAARLSLLTAQDPAKETAKHTREMVRWTKQTARNTRDGARFV